MEILNSSFAQNADTSGAPRTDGAGPGPLSSDFETFLKMLTTQMQNQDPLNPIESQDFAVQLATFSGVEQQVRTNDLLKSLNSGMGLAGITQLAGWVGMEARVDAPAEFDGAPITLSLNADAGSDEAVLVVRDVFGQIVTREAVPVDATTIEWAGVGTNGSPIWPGLYSFELESMNSGEITSIRPVEHYALVTEARQGPTGIEIVLRGGESVLAELVSALRNPATDP